MTISLIPRLGEEASEPIAESLAAGNPGLRPAAISEPAPQGARAEAFDGVVTEERPMASRRQVQVNHDTVTSRMLAILSLAWMLSIHAGASETNATERLKALKKEVLDAAAKSPSAAQRAADANIPSMLVLIRSIPDSPLTLETLRWVMLRAEVGSKPYEREVVELLRDHHAKNPQMGWICHGIGYYSSHWDDWRKPATMDLLRVVAESNPDRSARGQATLALARLIKNKAAYLQCFQKSIPAMRNTQTIARRAEYFER